jgi:hypothetical protein
MNPCEDNPCKGGGQCVAVNAEEVNCRCPEGRKGQWCQEMGKKFQLATQFLGKDSNNKICRCHILDPKATYLHMFKLVLFDIRTLFIYTFVTFQTLFPRLRICPLTTGLLSLASTAHPSSSCPRSDT